VEDVSNPIDKPARAVISSVLYLPTSSEPAVAECPAGLAGLAASGPAPHTAHPMTFSRTPNRHARDLIGGYASRINHLLWLGSMTSPLDTLNTGRRVRLSTKCQHRLKILLGGTNDPPCSGRKASQGPAHHESGVRMLTEIWSTTHSTAQSLHLHR